MDPPFFTNRVHDLRARPAPLTENGSPPEAPPRQRAFDDRWADQAAYLEALAPRIRLLRDMLSPHGSLVVHVDPKTSHYVKVLADEIFGPDAFASEIIWRYRRWPSRTDNFQRVHDVLLRYRKSPEHPPRWNTLFEPLALSTMATWGKNKQRAVFSGNRRARSSSTDEATPGVPLGDVWELSVLAPISKERTGYPSQKPLALIERLILSLTHPGDRVLDPYVGSGTTLVAAARQGRHFIGIDEGEAAVATTLSRLEEHGVTMERISPKRSLKKRVVSTDVAATGRVRDSF